MKNWILNSNRNFDKLNLWKLPILLVFIIITVYVDSHFFNNIPITLGGFVFLFVFWRMAEIWVASKENQLKKIK